MKKLRYSFFVFFISVVIFLTSGKSLFAQVHGNEWIFPGQSYYKINVGSTGLYAVSFDQIRAAGIPLSPSGSVQPEELQLFHRGVEQAVYVNNDSLFFYGKMNDGTLDSLLYNPHSKQPHKYYNLFSDTAAYFLTHASGASGKRMSVSNIPGTGTTELYHNAEVLTVLTNSYDWGYRYSIETYMTYGDQGEGWFGPTINTNGLSPVTATYNLLTPNVYSSGPQAQLEIMLVGRNGSIGGMIHKASLLIGNPSSPDLTFTIPTFAFHDVQTYTCSVPVSLLTSGNLSVSVRNNGIGDANYPSRISVAYIKLKYAQTFDMSGEAEKYINLIPNASVSYMDIPNAASGSRIFDITDKNNVGLIAATTSSGALKAVVNSSSAGRSLFVVSPSVYKTVAAIESVDMELYANGSSAEYIVITHQKLISSARQYASYRTSGQGGAYDTLVAEVQKLYNLFSYGEKSPVAIRRFMEYLFDIGDPKYVFIIGKALKFDYAFTGGVIYRKNPSYYINHTDDRLRKEDMIPTFGFPPSDLLYVNGLNGAPVNVCAIPLGRLSAMTNAEVENYLNKIQEHEQLPANTLWRKNLLHLSGGKTTQEKDAFLINVNQFKIRVEDTLFAGKVVKTISKKGSGSVDESMIESVVEEVNKGVSYITFFGHSSNNIIDLDIGMVSHAIYGYNNKGKYPFLIINGCQSAQTFGVYSFVEDWMITEDKGGIGALGHTDAGYATELKNYTNLFYKNAFQKRSLLGKPVGDIHRATISEFESIYGSSGAVNRSTLHQMVLQGDPALRVYTPELPDYEINDNKVSIKSLDNTTVTAVSDSFAISIVVSNFGVSFDDSLKVSVRRIINGKITDYPAVIYKSVKYQDTLLFVIKSKDAATYGENIFEITIDPLNDIVEFDEGNNSATLRYFIPLSGVVALYPKEYSIVSANPVTFIAQSTNLMVDARDYRIELDTSWLFDSPIKMQAVINGGSLIKWEDVSLPILQDSLVYYWRVRYENIAIGEDTLYGESSFIYINGSPPGWSQSEFPQFTKDNLYKVLRDVDQKSWSFEESRTPIYVKCVGSTYPFHSPGFSSPHQETNIRVNNVVFEFGGWCGWDRLLAVAFKNTTVNPYTPYPLPTGNMCGVNNSFLNFFNLLNDGINPPLVGNQNQANLMAFIDSVPTGDYVLFVSTMNAYFDSWTTALKDKFKNELGANEIDNLHNGMPYILLARKGDTDPVYEAYDPLTTGEIIFQDTLVGNYDQGYITSTLIGPASSWGTVYRTFQPSEATPVTDAYDLKLIRIDIEGNPVDTLTLPAHDTIDISGLVNPNQYPYIRLFADITDFDNLTPPQLNKWQVIYGGVPEGIMNPALVGLSTYNSVTKQEGDSISLCYAFENISDYDFTDTLQVKYTITNPSKGVSSQTAKLVPLKQDSIITFCHKFSTGGFLGNNVIQAYVNPKILREEYYNNNIIESSFIVEEDRIHPILDVVFDGVHIMDGDIVSPNPLITVTLNDENPYLIRNNLDGMEIFLLSPGDDTPQPVDMNSTSIVNAKQVGTNGKNIYQIEYNPQNLPDGVYKLIVKAQDVAGNDSGVEDYIISFEVINESTISNFYPYPNPFSSSTRFVFTLTGSEIPEDMKIQIMTVTGRVVREITKAEMGAIRIGNNKTDYAWDGTDEFGDKLANGVYLYRVVIKNDTFEHRDTAGDKAFKKNFGKLYILR